jgi:hypothetical protein
MLRYTVFHQGQAKKAFHFFFDAWLYAFLELPSYSRIRGPDGVWTVNPHSVN